MKDNSGEQPSIAEEDNKNDSSGSSQAEGDESDSKPDASASGAAISDDSPSQGVKQETKGEHEQPGGPIDIYDDSDPIPEFDNDIYYNNDLILTHDECVAIYENALQGLKDCFHYETEYPGVVNSLEDINSILNNYFSNDVSKKLTQEYFAEENGAIVIDCPIVDFSYVFGRGHIASANAISNSAIVLREISYYRADFWNEDYTVCVNKIYQYAAEDLLLVKADDNWVLASVGLPGGLSCTYFRDDTQYNDIELKQWEIRSVEDLENTM